jgi:hypothetical protein
LPYRARQPVRWLGRKSLAANAALKISAISTAATAFGGDTLGGGAPGAGVVFGAIAMTQEAANYMSAEGQPVDENTRLLVSQCLRLTTEEFIRTRSKQPAKPKQS